MFFGFMNKREKEVYNQYMYNLLKDKADIYGRVSQQDWNAADRVATRWVANLVKNGLI